MLFVLCREYSKSANIFPSLPETVAVLAAETAVLLEVTVGTKGREAANETEGPRGILGPSGNGLLTAVLVNVEVPETLVRVGVARLSSLDVSGSWMGKKRKLQKHVHCRKDKESIVAGYAQLYLLGGANWRLFCGLGGGGGC